MSGRVWQCCLLVLASQIWVIQAIMCADSQNGTCEAAGVFAWCHYSVTNGTFGCDDQKICARQESIRNKKIATCINDASDCCCNKGGIEKETADLCNYKAVLIMGKKKMNANQTIRCDTTASHKSDETTFGECFDQHCVKFLYRREGTPTGGGQVNSCQTWLHYGNMKYNEGALSYGAYNGFGIVGRLLDDEKYRCSELLKVTDKPSVCVETKIQFRNVPYTGRYCCCSDGDKCNTDLGWGHELSDPDATQTGATFTAHITTVFTIFVVSIIFQNN